MVFILFMILDFLAALARPKIRRLGVCQNYDRGNINFGKVDC